VNVHLALLASGKIVGSQVGVGRVPARDDTNMPLSDTSCRNAKGREKPYKLTDGDGMHLLVQSNGSRLWRLSYRFDGKQKTLALGIYPAVGLGLARERRIAARKLLADRIDPSIARKAERRGVGHTGQATFESVAREWHTNERARWVPAHSARIMSRLENDVFPALGSRPVQQVEAPELLEMLRAVEARGALDIAKRLRQSVGAIFRYAIATGRAKRDPAADLKGALKAAPRVEHHAALGIRELPEFLARLDKYDGDEQTPLAVKLVLLTFVRSGEVRFAEWREFEDLEGEAPIWRIPARRMKAGREHIIPLAPQTLSLLRDLRALDGANPYVFPARTKTGVISENTMIFALYRLGYHSRQTVHGFRRIASTVLNEEGFNRDWIELQLAHSPQDGVRAAYNAAEWLQGRRKMMAWWADRLEEFRKSYARNIAGETSPDS
jgi:integrase